MSLIMRVVSLSLLAPLLSFVALAACNSGGQATESAGSSETGDASSGGSTAPTGGADCGDDQLNGDEVCDGPALGDKQCADLEGFVGGVLACA
ncbi:MAG: hypothetical protein H0T76_08920, partial [Nannocystis sp.]|nr:hypothetical protein [Nannocystis sp.]